MRGLEIETCVESMMMQAIPWRGNPCGSLQRQSDISPSEPQLWWSLLGGEFTLARRSIEPIGIFHLKFLYGFILSKDRTHEY